MQTSDEALLAAEEKRLADLHAAAQRRQQRMAAEMQQRIDAQHRDARAAQRARLRAQIDLLAPIADAIGTEMEALSAEPETPANHIPRRTRLADLRDALTAVQRSPLANDLVTSAIGRRIVGAALDTLPAAIRPPDADGVYSLVGRRIVNGWPGLAALWRQLEELDSERGSQQG